jgi:hypothetical protein
MVDCRRLKAEQREIHFKMNGAVVVQESAVEEDWATSHDFTNAFNHMLVNAEYVPYLAFSHRGDYYAYAAMPFGTRHTTRVFTRALAYALAYIRSLGSAHDCLCGRCPVPAPGQGLSGAFNVADLLLPALVGVDTLTGKV